MNDNSESGNTDAHALLAAQAQVRRLSLKPLADLRSARDGLKNEEMPCHLIFYYITYGWSYYSSLLCTGL